MTIWLQASGDGERIYSDLCLEYDVILNGPGVFGAFDNQRYLDLVHLGSITKWKHFDLRRFASEITEGDVVVLHRGYSEVCGIGRVVGEYLWTEIFEDVDGWDLQHCRRVQWLWTKDNNDYDFGEINFGPGATTRKLSLIKYPHLVKAISQIIQRTEFTRKVCSLPRPGVTISLQDLSDIIEDSKTRTDFSVAVTNIRSLLEWYDDLYKKHKHIVSEDETRSYLTIPLLFSLGYINKRIAIEHNRMDIVFYDNESRDKDHVIGIVEMKRKGKSCFRAFDQANQYALKLPSCRFIVVSDGSRYSIFKRQSNNGFTLDSYLNLSLLRDSNPIYHCQGAIAVLRCLVLYCNR